MQAEDMTIRNGHHEEAKAFHNKMSKDIEDIMQAHHARKTAGTIWSDVDYVARGESLHKHAAVLQGWQDEFLTKGVYPEHADVKGLWAKIMSVEVLSAEDRKLKNELMYGPHGCSFFFENA